MKCTEKTEILNAQKRMTFYIVLSVLSVQKRLTFQRHVKSGGGGGGLSIHKFTVILNKAISI